MSMSMLDMESSVLIRKESCRWLELSSIIDDPLSTSESTKSFDVVKNWSKIYVWYQASTEVKNLGDQQSS